MDDEKRKDTLDSFWDLSKLVPSKKTSLRERVQDTCGTKIKLASELIKTPERADGEGERIPPRARAEQKPPLLEYDAGGRFIKHIKITPWPVDFNFYSRFRSDAAKYLNRKGEECPYVYFFSYMPRYEQLDTAQLGYYFYFRDAFRQGEYINADCSYVFLLLYEIINLPDLIPPERGAGMICRLWAMYRERYRYLDKYVGEWLCDYCLIHRVSPDYTVIGGFIAGIAEKLALPEFFADTGENGTIPFGMLRQISAYDFSKSRFFPEHEAEWMPHVEKAVTSAVNAYFSQKPEAVKRAVSKFTRDSFTGAVASVYVKYKIEVECITPRRSHVVRQIVTDTIKYCENRLRAIYSIKARYQKLELPECIVSEIDAYFSKEFPGKGLSKKGALTAEEQKYMALYEPEHTGEADIEKALSIESDSWKTAELLEAEETEEDVEAETPPVEPDGAREISDEPYTELVSLLDDRLRDMLVSALEGKLTFYCRTRKIMPEDAARQINELAGEYTGDIVIDGDFTVIDDYREDIISAFEKINKRQEKNDAEDT